MDITINSKGWGTDGWLGTAETAGLVAASATSSLNRAFSL